MKKITSLFLGLIVMASASFAQPKMESKKAEKKASVEKMAPAAKPAQAKVVKMTPAPKVEAAAKGAPTKKDGTPDKRFKANKGAKAEGPTKKDGTPDMRFKKNKPAEKKAA